MITVMCFIQLSPLWNIPAETTKSKLTPDFTGASGGRDLRQNHER